MNELTEDDIIISSRGSDEYPDEYEIEITVPNDCRNWHKKEAEEFKKQLLEKEEKAEKYTEFVQKLHETSGQSLSLEECDKIIQKHVGVEQENKQLKDRIEQLENYLKEPDINKQKLEKIEKVTEYELRPNQIVLGSCEHTNFYGWKQTFCQKLKEILSDK